MTRTLHSEWTKLRTVPSTGWLLLAIVVLTVAVGFAVTGTLNAGHCRAPCFEDTPKLSLLGVRLSQTAVVVLAVMAITTEHTTRLATYTFAATPNRLVVLAAKLVAVTGLVLVAGAAGVYGSMLAANAVLPGHGFTVANGYHPLSLGDDVTRRAAIGTALYLALVGLLSMGLGALIRDTAASVGAVLALLYGVPMVAAFVTSQRWQHRLHRWSPMDAGLAIQTTRDLATAAVGPWAGLGILAAYAGVAILAGGMAFRIRDASS